MTNQERLCPTGAVEEKCPDCPFQLQPRQAHSAPKIEGRAPKQATEESQQENGLGIDPSRIIRKFPPSGGQWWRM